ncbi:hypothetical protein [Paracoccus shanxieyensis]|uniref:Transglycosylase SLT domain-containing protein n=1 Tax=Paracoccus shanxieyensis TaxID=2675752 RepID=A0A6L6J2W4_9RHOB|nr:hypothetical protein [Paracoccus shanxieyensis]MTH65077.1 hypothetical protein [Paracoccus shanxieyensis]MTH88221.1 hypothetical protein [Paracoccus shanxieyensis]
MAMRVPTYERQQVVQARTPVPVAATQPQLGRVAQGVADVGKMFDQWQADVDEADAKAADTAFAKTVRDTLYDPNSGYLYARGGDALTRRKEAADTLQRAFDERLSGLNATSRDMASRSMQGALDGAFTKIDAHAGGERLTYLDGQSQARVQSAIDDAIIDPGNLARSLGIARAEVRDQAARGGWSPEQTTAAMMAAESNMHTGVITRLSSVNPTQALDYLNANRGNMSAASVATLEKQLVPEAKAYRGREIGRGLAQGTSGGIPESYYASARAAESGGDDTAKNPNSSATGRYQFVSGTWNQLIRQRPDLGLTPEGRLDPAQQERAMRAFTEANAKTLMRGGIAITNGTLYAAHFLGAGGALKVLSAPMSAAVSSVVGPGVVEANKFLAGMTVADFAAWAERKGGGAAGSAPMPMGGFEAPAWGGGETQVQAPVDPITQILNMDDPDERSAALEEYKLFSGQMAAQAKAAQDSAQQAAFMLIESGGSVDSLSLEQKMQIGQSGMTSLREYQGKVRSGQDSETDPGLYVELQRQAVTDPAGFAARDPLEWRGSLDDEDFKALVRKQAEVLKSGANQEKQVTISTIDTVSRDLLLGAGIDPKKRTGAQQYAKYQEGMLRWSQAFTAQNSREPSHLELRERANAMLLPIVINPPGLFNEVGGKLYEMDFDGVTAAGIRDGSLSLGDQTVDPAQVEAFAMAFEAAMGRAPTPQELVEGLASVAAGGADLTGE